MPTQFKLRRPVDDDRPISQYFGENPQVYAKFNQAGHEGIDFIVPVGANVYAAADGQVFDVRPDNSEYGIHVRIRHLVDGREYRTVYAHLSKALVSKGQSVKAGEVIALSGNTGHSFGPHLHLTLKLIGAQTPGYPAGVVDPLPYLQGQPPEHEEPLEPTDRTIYTSDEVRMRARPTTFSPQVAWLAKDEALTILGDVDAARAKVGQFGQWISVRRADGTDGYVAAWYTRLKSPAPPPAPTPEPAPAGAFVVYATVPLNVREGPSTGTIRTAIALPNEPLTVIGDVEAAKANIGDRGDWLQVRLPDGSEGYVAAWYMQTQPGPAPTSTLTVYPTEDMNMRAQPSVGGRLVQRLAHNAPLTVHDGLERARTLVGQYGEWLYVETAEGQRGWVAAWYVSAAKT
jgi:uncharacterized protein YgiM (DUF1202 family)